MCENVRYVDSCWNHWVQESSITERYTDEFLTYSVWRIFHIEVFRAAIPISLNSPAFANIESGPPIKF